MLVVSCHQSVALKQIVSDLSVQDIDCCSYSAFFLTTDNHQRTLPKLNHQIFLSDLLIFSQILDTAMITNHAIIYDIALIA